MEIEIVNYIKDARQHGLSDQEIKQNLLDVGWEAAAVEDSFAHVRLSEVNPVLQIPPSISQAESQKLLHVDNGIHLHEKLPAHSEPAIEHVEPITHAAPQHSTASEHVSLAPAVSSTVPINTTPSRPKARKLPLVLGGVFVLLLIGGYSAYAYAVANPQKIWTKFLDRALSQQISTAQYQIQFTSPGGEGEAKLSLSGTSYVNSSAGQQPQFDATVNFAYSGSGQPGNKNFRVIGKDNVLYVDLSSLAELTSALGQAPGWVKLDFQEAAKLGNSSSSQPSFADFETKVKTEVVNALKNKKIFKSYKYIGTEQINGVSTYHLKNEVDKEQLKQTIVEVLANTARDLGQVIQQKEIDNATAQVSTALDKIDIQPVEVWIGKKDFLPYKVSYNISFTGLSNNDFLSNLPLFSNAASDSRDFQRISDIKKLSAALELYNNDHNGYPAGVNGVPQGLVSNYLSTEPGAPTPSDGNCSDYYNTYWYTPLGTAKTTNGLVVYPDYQLTFCLGKTTTNNKAGIGKLTPKGIETGLACNDKPENCRNSNSQQSQPNNVGTGGKANLSAQITYSDYGKTKDVSPPTDAVDLLQLFGSRSANTTASSSNIH